MRILALVLTTAACAPAVRSPARPPSPTPANAEAPAPADPKVRARAVPPPAFTDPNRRERVVAALPDVEGHIAGWFAQEKVPGLAVGVVLDDELIFAKGWGVRDLASGDEVTPKSVFRIGSITKVFTATAALVLRDAGKLDLDAAAVTTLPELAKLEYPSAGSQPVTLRQLLTHTAGLPRLGDFSYVDPDKDLSRAEIFASLEGFGLRSPPGDQHLYSNLGFMLAGLAVERAAGQPYREFVGTALLEPLGMRATVWREQDVAAAHRTSGYAGRRDPKLQKHWRLGAGAGAGGLYSSVEDMARFAAAQLSAWPADGREGDGPLRRSSIREAQRPGPQLGLRVRVTQDGINAKATSRGLGWGIYSDCEFARVIRHNGGTEGYRSALTLVPRRGVAVIVLTNANWADPSPLASEVLGKLAASGGLDVRRPQPAPQLLAAVDGLLELTRTWDDDRYAALFAETFREAVPGATMRLQMARLLVEVGPCEQASPERMDDAYGGRFVLRCEKGELEVSLRARPTRTPTLTRVRLAVRGGPAPEPVLQLARQVTRLLRKWNRRAFDKYFSKNFEADGIQAFFRRVTAAHGSCKLGEVQVHTPESARVTLTCTKRKRSMIVAIDPADPTKIARLIIRGADGESSRCLD